MDADCVDVPAQTEESGGESLLQNLATYSVFQKQNFGDLESYDVRNENGESLLASLMAESNNPQKRSSSKEKEANSDKNDKKLWHIRAKLKKKDTKDESLQESSTGSSMGERKTSPHAIVSSSSEMHKKMDLDGGKGASGSSSLGESQKTVSSAGQREGEKDIMPLSSSTKSGFGSEKKKDDGQLGFESWSSVLSAQQQREKLEAEREKQRSISSSLKGIL